MGVGAISLLDTGFDLTPFVDRESFSIEVQANKLNGVLNATCRDETGALRGLLKERVEIIATDDGSRIYGGQIATIAPRLDGSAVEYTIKCQSFDCLLDQRAIESGLRDRSGGDEYDDDDVRWIISFAADLGLTAVDFVSRVRTDPLGVIDYSFLTLRQALDRLVSETIGASYWVDENKKLHWVYPQSAQLVKNADFENTGGVDWSLTSATTNVDGGPGGIGDECAEITTVGGSAHQIVHNVVGDRRYVFFADLYGDVDSGATITLDWQNSSGTSQRIDMLDNGATLSEWTRQKALYVSPAAAAQVVVTVKLASGSLARFDNINLVGEDAAFGVSTTPDGTTTRHMWDWEQPSDAATPVNRVLVKGNGISGWREHAASIAYFGQKFEGVLSDERVTTEAGIDSRADYVFSKYAFPAHSGKYQTDESGLSAGTWQIIEVDRLGLQAIEWIATLRVTFDGDLNMLYDVTYGAPEDDLGAMMVSIGSVFADSTGELGVAQVHVPGSDSTPPAIPTGLTLTTGAQEAEDGSLQPYLIASWTAVGDVDLDAYEVQLDRAIDGDVVFAATASGTGGTLPAGDYAVQVTGIGAEGGETAATSAPQVVTIAAGQRLFVNITPKTGIVSYKVYASILTDTEEQPEDTGQTTSTTGSDVEVLAAGTGGVNPPIASTAVAFLNPTEMRTDSSSVFFDGLVGGVYYAARVRAVDTSRNESGWSTIVGQVVALDTSAPSVPTGVSLATGYRLIGVRWQPNPEPDLAFYQVRFAPEDPANPGFPDTSAWTRITTSTNWVLLSGLDAGSPDGSTLPVTYFVEVRAIDRSGNVATSLIDPTAVDYTSNPEAGWSNDGTNDTFLSAVPVLLSGQTDVAYGTIQSEHIVADGLDASLIKAGQLQVGGQPNMPDVLIVYDANGNEIGRWDEGGLLITDPTDPTRQVRVLDGALQFSADGGTTWTTALDADGIVADAVKLGVAPGGHNAVPNASFELAAFSSALAHAWEADQAWSTAIGTSINVTLGSTALALSTFTF